MVHGLGPGCARGLVETRCEEFHRSGLIQLAKGEAVRSRVGEEGLEASTRITELACNRATDDQRIVTTWIRAPMARQNVQTQSQKYLSTISHQQPQQPMDISAVMTGSMLQSCGSQTRQRHDCWYKDETCKIRGKRGQEVHKRREGEAPREKRTLETCMCCGKEGHKKADYKFKSATLFHLQQSWSLESGVSEHEHT